MVFLFDTALKILIVYIVYKVFSKEYDKFYVDFYFFLIFDMNEDYTTAYYIVKER